MRSILNLLKKTTLTPKHFVWMVLTLLLYGFLLYMTYPYGLWGSIVAFLMCGTWSVAIEPRLLKRRDFTHAIPSWSSQDSIQVAVIGDLHIGSPFATLERLRRMLIQIEAENPDVLLLVGDYVIQGVIGGQHVPISEVVKVLETCSIPCLAIIGNHDVRDGRDNIHAAFQDSSIHFLENEHHTMCLKGKDITFVGLDDESTGTPLPDRAFPKSKPNHPIVCLAHDPATFLRNLPYESDLCLAGHTHGGQVRIPGIGALVLPGKSPLAWSYGWVTTNNGPLYVTSGFGTSIAPIRFCAPPEYVLMTLTGTPSEQ